MTSPDKVNYILGLRAWGLILYGALPANLALLGTLEVKLGNIENFSPILLPTVCLLPILITFLLVRNRCQEWYLTTDFLMSRSIITTFLIILCATLISGAAGIINGKYVLSLSNILNQTHLKTITESFLFGISSLVLTSTLFMTIFTKATDLPWLPSSKFVGELDKIRNWIRQIKRSQIYIKYDDLKCNDSNDFKTVKEVQEIIKVISGSFEELMSYPLHKTTKQSLEIIKDSIKSFNEALEYIKAVDTSPDVREFRWKIFFENFASPIDDLGINREEYEKLYNAVLEIKNLQIGE